MAPSRISSRFAGKASTVKASPASKSGLSSVTKRAALLKTMLRSKTTGLLTPPSTVETRDGLAATAPMTFQQSKKAEVGSGRHRETLVVASYADIVKGKGKPTKNVGGPKGRMTVKPVEGTLLIRTPKIDASKIDEVMDDIPGPAGGYSLPEGIQNILTHPSRETPMEEFGIAFEALKTQIQHHCRKYFTWTASTKAHHSPLNDLKESAPETFSLLQQVADGRQYGWEKLLNAPNQRENLAYAMISRTLTVHMFDQELFGADDATQGKLLDMCREYIDYDGFVRSIHRAEIIKAALGDETDFLQPASDRLGLTSRSGLNFTPAIATLGDSLDRLTAPFLDPRPFPSLARLSSLASILRTAFRLHIAVRLHGATGSVFRYDFSFLLSPWNGRTMNCVNQVRVDLTATPGSTTVPLVKVPCFPAVYASVPAAGSRMLESFTQPGVAAHWAAKARLDPRSRRTLNPFVSIYPVALADVVLENTPRDAAVTAKHPSLAQALVREAAALTKTRSAKRAALRRSRRQRTRLLALGLYGVLGVLGYKVVRNEGAVGEVARRLCLEGWRAGERMVQMVRSWDARGVLERVTEELETSATKVGDAVRRGEKNGNDPALWE